MDLDFRNSDLKTYFWANLRRKGQSLSFCLNICTHDILEELIPTWDLDFRNSHPKIHFRANFVRKSIPCLFLFLRPCCCLWTYT